MSSIHVTVPIVFWGHHPPVHDITCMARYKALDFDTDTDLYSIIGQRRIKEQPLVLKRDRYVSGTYTGRESMGNLWLDQ